MDHPRTGRRLIVQVQWGPLAFHKAIIPPGQTLQVGRSESAGLSVPHDVMMASTHFELTWDGNTCRIRDLKSTTGTLLDGQVVHEEEVGNGSWLRAGTTDFVMYFEGFTPPREPTEQEVPAVGAHKARVLELLRKQEASLFAVLDAARDQRIPILLRESVEEYRSLYEGAQGNALAEVAPYLVSLPKDSRLLESLVSEGWNRSWGLYLTCPLPFLEVRRHLRKFLMVQAEGTDARLYFRFYDPRVLRTVMPTFSTAQRKDLLGPINCFIFEAEDGSVLQENLRSDIP